MKVKGKLTPKLRARVLELAKAGGTNRGIEATLRREGTSLSRETIRSILGGLQGVKGQGGPVSGHEEGEEGEEVQDGEGVGLGAGKEQGKARGERGGGLKGDEGSVDPTEEPMPPLPEDASLAAITVWQQLRDVRQVARDLRPKVMSQEYPATQWASLQGTALRLMKTLHEMLPPAKPDPAKDPTNIAAREMIHAHVLGAIGAAEAKQGRLCPNCSKPRG